MDLRLATAKRLTPPFSSREDEAAAEVYWQAAGPQARTDAMNAVIRAFWKWRGVDITAPRTMKTMQIISFEQKNRDHEEFHRLFAEWKAQQD